MRLPLVILAHSLVFGSTYAQNEVTASNDILPSAIDFRLLRGKDVKMRPLLRGAILKEASNSPSNVLTKASIRVARSCVDGTRAGGVVTTFSVHPRICEHRGIVPLGAVDASASCTPGPIGARCDGEHSSYSSVGELRWRGV